MRRRLPAGLRWRLLLALVATSAITLAVAALVVLQPLQQRLRDQSAENLVSAAVAAPRGVLAGPRQQGGRPRDRRSATDRAS